MTDEQQGKILDYSPDRPDRATLHRRTVALTQAVATVAIQGGKPEDEVLRIAGIYDHWIETGRTPAETVQMHEYMRAMVQEIDARQSGRPR